MDEKETHEEVDLSYSTELHENNDFPSQSYMETEENNVSTLHENKKKSDNPVLVFGSAPSTNTKIVKSAIFEFGSSLCTAPDKELSDNYCGIESDNSSGVVDLFSSQDSVQTDMELVDKGPHAENECQDNKCISNERECNSEDTGNVNEMCDDNASVEKITGNKYKFVSTNECKENELDTFNSQQNQNVDDALKSAFRDKIHQRLESSSKESQAPATENNTAISSCKSSVSHTNVVNTSVDNENYFVVNMGEENVEECSESELVNEKSSDPGTDQYMECKSGIESIEDVLLDEIHVGQDELVEELTNNSDNSFNENSNTSLCSNKNSSKKEDNEITNISNRSIEIIKDAAHGSTFSITLEDVEMSVFEEHSPDNLSLLLEPTQKVKENTSLINNSAVNKDTKHLKLNDTFTDSDQGASQDSIECDTSTLKESDLFIHNNQLNQNESSTEVNKDADLEIFSKITTISLPKHCEENQEHSSKEVCEESDINKKEPISAVTKKLINESDNQNIVPSEIAQKSYREPDSSLDANSPDSLEVENKSNYKDNNSNNGILENNYNSSKEESEEECPKVATKSKTSENTTPISDDNEDSNEEILELENIIQSALNKNQEFRKTVEKETCEKNKSMVNTEVICLFDDDDELYSKKKKPAAAIKCVNPNCMSGEGLDKPAMFVLSYFGLKHTKDQLVCQDCFSMVSEHHEKLAAMLKEGTPLFSADFPSHKDVILLDSDEESSSDDESNLSDDTMEMIRENLDDVIAESLAKFRLDHQIRESCHLLDNKIEAMEDEAKELGKRFDQVQNTLDEFRKQIYENFNHPIKEIEELHFTDCEIPPMPILKNKLQNQLYNMELMKTFKRSQQNRDDSSAGQRHSSGNSRTIATKKVTQISQTQFQTDNATQDVIALHSETRRDPPPNLPPAGPLRRPKLRVGDIVYAMKVSCFSIWVPSRVIEIIPRNRTESDPSTEAYRVRFENMKKNIVRTVTGTYLAYDKPSATQLKVGVRVIAIFKEEDELSTDKENFYVGVIAEPPKSTNNYRYLVFFDDGYTQYCPHESIRVVCNSNKNVWEDIHPEPRKFIENYLQQYPERPMVKLSQGQVVKVEWNCRWWIVRVLEVDASLVKVHFDADNRTEWIYRGSTRLGPMYQELAAAKERQSGSLLRSRGFGGACSKSDMPYVEYTRGDGDEKKDEEKDEQEEDQQPVVPARSVARKSTAKKSAEPVISNPVYAKPLVNQLPQGKLMERTLRPLCKPRKFRPHQCNTLCVEWTNYTPANKRYDPLVTPLMFGFARMNMVFRGKNLIMYKAPCGRTIRSQQEMLCYLQATKSSLTIDLFDFDFWVNPLNIYEEGNTFGRIEDLSYGKENVPISCVNELDHSMPQYVQYMTARQPAKDVNLNLEPEFLVGCDCTDDCEDRSKCSCWQLTMQGKAYVPDGELDPLFGYQYRRLPERIATGIYECNSKCKCSATCLNRVAQQPLSYRLQLFKTLKKGWGIRCLHDIPRGAFICIYAGFLLTEAEANEGGKAYGDEYLAELDYIESVEGLKEGYESEARDVSDPEDEPIEMDIEYEQEHDLDSDENNEVISKNRQEDIRLRLRRRTVDELDKDSGKKSKQDDDSISISDDEISPDAYYYTVAPISEKKVRKPQTFNVSITENEERESKYPSVRDLYGQDEQVYIMDAKTHGNIGRYLNHSCSPNVFVQNVFVDTHDLRFPWVAFFANQYVTAGTELTWDYNYDVGSVPGKVMLCYCGSPNCRGRLL